MGAVFRGDVLLRTPLAAVTGGDSPTELMAAGIPRLRGTDRPLLLQIWYENCCDLLLERQGPPMCPLASSG
jgi:hypothetical protein